MPRWDTVALIGVGLIGGSIGLALRDRGAAKQIVGIGRSASTLRRARRVGAVTATTTNLAKGVRDAELVIVCTPVETVVRFVLEAAEHAPPGSLFTDVASTKAAIVAELDRRRDRLASRKIRFVGSHPLAGSEKTGPQNARADLLDGRVVVVTPSARTRSADYREIERLWQHLGAKVLRQSPSAHDQAVAAISHLPHLVASALAAGTPTAALPLAAGGWLDSTRVAAGDVELWRQILADNRDHVLKSLSKFETVLTSFREALETEDDTRLVRLLKEGKRQRDAVGN